MFSSDSPPTQHHSSMSWASPLIRHSLRQSNSFSSLWQSFSSPFAEDSKSATPARRATSSIPSLPASLGSPPRVFSFRLSSRLLPALLFSPQPLPRPPPSLLSLHKVNSLR